MDCPRFDSELEEEIYKDIEVDQGVSCEGMWLDYAELDRFEDTAMGA